MSTNAYRGFKSTTFILVLMGFWTGTGLLIADFITAQIWETSVLGLVSCYIIRAGIGSAAEAYVTAKTLSPQIGGSNASPVSGPIG